MSHAAEHRLERRSRLLAGEITRRVETLGTMLGPRPLWSEAKTRNEALAWWRKHRFDDLGSKILIRLKPDQIAGLDQALTDETEQAQLTPGWPAEEV